MNTCNYIVYMVHVFCCSDKNLQILFKPFKHFQSIWTIVYIISATRIYYLNHSTFLTEFCCKVLQRIWLVFFCLSCNQQCRQQDQYPQELTRQVAPERIPKLYIQHSTYLSRHDHFFFQGVFQVPGRSVFQAVLYHLTLLP